jgi:hypothetical protein
MQNAALILINKRYFSWIIIGKLESGLSLLL